MVLVSALTVGVVVLLGAVAVLAGWSTMRDATATFVEEERKNRP